MLRDFGPARFGAVVLLAAWLPLTILHELGHALMARAFGWRVIEISVGIGRRVAHFQVGETQVDLRLWPLAGHVLPVPRSVEGARLASTCIYLAGPGIELAVIAAIAVVMGPGELLSAQPGYLGVAAQAVCVAALWGAGFNLLPFTTPAGQWTDGAGALRSPFMPDAHFERMMAAPAVKAAERDLAAGRPAAAVDALTPLMVRHPEAVDLQITYALALDAAGEREAALVHLTACRREAEGAAAALYDAALARVRLAHGR